MIVPASHSFKLIDGAQFDFRFEYLTGGLDSTTPIDLTSYQGLWTITLNDRSTIWNEYSTGNLIGTSGVFFGGDTYDPTNGIIDLVLTSYDTSNLPWNYAAYYFSLITPTLDAITLLRGSISVLDYLPS